MPVFVQSMFSALAVMAVLAMAADAIAARKGTRNYRADDAGSASSQPPEINPVSTTRATDPIKQCIAIWDPGTHMTKDEWREACRRITHDRPSAPGSE